MRNCTRALKRQRRGAATCLRLLALSSYLCCTFGFPVPGRKAYSGHERFPCWNRPCGCQTALQCWTSCKCFSPAQRVVWARQNGQPTPSYAVLPPPEELERLLTDECCDLPARNASGCCCSEPETGVPPKPSPEPAHDAPKLICWAVGVLAAKCGGLAGQIGVTFDVSLPPPVASVQPDLTPVALTHWLPFRGNPLRETPPSPPPER